MRLGSRSAGPRGGRTVTSGRGGSCDQTAHKSTVVRVPTELRAGCEVELHMNNLRLSPGPPDEPLRNAVTGAAPATRTRLKRVIFPPAPHLTCQRDLLKPRFIRCWHQITSYSSACGSVYSDSKCFIKRESWSWTASCVDRRCRAPHPAARLRVGTDTQPGCHLCVSDWTRSGEAVLRHPPVPKRVRGSSICSDAVPTNYQRFGGIVRK